MDSFCLKNVYWKCNNTKTNLLKNLNFAVKQGDFHAFVGENGAGKSTTIRLIVGLSPNYEGELFINDLNAKEHIEARVGVSYIPPHIANKRFDYNIDTAFYSYNKALKNIYDAQKSLPETTKKLMIKPEEVLTIYNSGDSQLEFCYSEYLTSSSSFNSPLLSLNNVTLFNNEAEITAAIKTSKMLEPAKIIVIYDVLGNIINAGVRLSSDDKLSTTNDAVYDAQNSVIDNILRTKVIRNDPSKTFYLEKDGTYTFLKNTKDVIYKLDWNKKVYFFQHSRMRGITFMSLLKQKQLELLNKEINYEIKIK